MDTATNEDVQDIIQKISRAKEFSKGWHINIDRWRKLYDMEHYSNRPRKGEVQYNDPTYTNTVDLAVGIMLGNDLHWHAFGLNPSHKEEHETGIVEKLMTSILAANDEREETHQLYELFTNSVRDGGGVIYSVFDPVIAKTSLTTINSVDPENPNGVTEIDAFTENPIRAQVIDPAKFYLLPGGPRRWLMAGRIEKMSVQDVEILFDVKLERYAGYSALQKLETQGEFTDMWDWVRVPASSVTDSEGNVTHLPERMVVRNTILFDNEPIKGPRIMQGYEDLPYTVQFYKPTSRTDSSRWYGILAPLESTISQLERSVNRRARQIDIFTALPIVSKTQPGRPVSVDAAVFSHVQLQPDESIEFPQWPGNAPDVQIHIDFLRSRIQQSGFSDVMFGSGSNQIAGYAVSQLGDQNRIRLEQPIKHLELLLSQWAKKVLSMLSKFASGTKICIYGQHRGHDFVEYVDVETIKDYSVRAEIVPNYPNEQTRKVAMASQVKGTLSDYTIMQDYLGIEQPEDEEDRKLIETVSRDPAVIKYTIMKELKQRALPRELGGEGDDIAAMVLQSLQSGTMADGQPGRPKDPNSPAGFSGMPSATGELTPQEQGQQPFGQSASDQMNNMANSAPGMDGTVG